MRSLLTAALTVVFLASASPAAHARDTIPSPWIEPASEIVGWFETSGAGKWGAITPDFDCQGLSAGILQWNIGKNSLWEIVLSRLPQQVFQEKMPRYGTSFRDAMASGRDEALRYVRDFQSYKDSASCNGNRRGARWTSEGRRFAAEVSALMESNPVRVQQKKAMTRKLDDAWSYAMWWARDKRGPDATPNFQELVFFYDTLNFNGRWTEQANHRLVREFRNGRPNREVMNDILQYLRSDVPGQLQRDEARRNAELWAETTPDDEKTDLMVFAFLIAKNISKPYAAQFRFNTISRRGTIVFNDGWVNGTRMSFKMPQ